MEKENKLTCLDSTGSEDIFEEIDKLLEFCEEKLSNIVRYTICGLVNSRIDVYVLDEEDALNAQGSIQEVKNLINQLKRTGNARGLKTSSILDRQKKHKGE